MKFPLGRFPWLHDWLTLRSVEYVAVFHEDRAELVRLSGRNRTKVVLQVEAGESRKATAGQFFDRLRTSPVWYGQPFAVLVNNRKVFTYARHLSATDPADLRKRLQLLAGESHDFRWSIERFDGQECVVGQGIDRDYLTYLIRCIEGAGLPVCGLGTLDAQSAPGLPEGAETSQRDRIRCPAITPYRFRTSKVATGLQRSLNVGRLLTAVLGSIGLVMVIVVLTLAGGSGHDSNEVRLYQNRYSHKLELESWIAQMRRELARADRARPAGTQSASLVSLFCQERVAGAYLTRLAVRHWGSDSTTIEAKGRARRENQIFDYVALLNRSVVPNGFAINSITPEVIASLGQPDTVQSFRLSLVVHEQIASK